MHEVKFRVYDTFLKEMTGPKDLKVSIRNGKIESLSYKIVGNAITSEWMSYDQSGDGLDEKRYKLMQFTGLRGKDGVEIYEDDLVLGRYYPTEALIVYWDTDMCGWELRTHDGSYSEHLLDLSGDMDGNWEWEVVGNRWQL